MLHRYWKNSCILQVGDFSFVDEADVYVDLGSLAWIDSSADTEFVATQTVKRGEL